MLGWLQDTLDDLAGYDHSLVRFVLLIVVANVILFFVLFAPWHWFEGNDCDALCQQNIQRIIQETNPDLYRTPSPFNADEFIRDALTATPTP